MSATGLESLRVLLVEDNPNMRQIIITVLAGVGVRRIIEASDGHEALRLLKTNACDFVIVDFNMSPMDGAAFTEYIRGHPDSPNPFLPIIMMTGYADRAHVERARDAGVNEFVVKPMTAQAIFDRINAVIQRPRSFVRSPSYFGPDRRRRTDLRYSGPWRRAGDPRPIDG